MGSKPKRPNRSTPGQLQADLVRLMSFPEFKRFLFHIAEQSGMWSATATGSEHRILEQEGRRNLGFEIFQWVEEALGLPNGNGIAVATMVTVLLEEAKPQGVPDDTEPEDESQPYDRTRI